MTLARLFTDTATVVTFTAGDDPRGDRDAGTWGDGASYPGRFQQLATTEDLAGRDTSTADWLLVLPADAVLGPKDRVKDQHDNTFEVVGVPAKPTRPGTGVHHLEVQLRAVVN